MEIVKKFGSWVVTVLFAGWAIMSFPSVGTILFLLGLATFVPIRAWQETLTEKGVRLPLKIMVAIVSLIAGSVLTPQDRFNYQINDEPLKIEETVENEIKDNGQDKQEKESDQNENRIVLTAGEKGDYGKTITMNNESIVVFYLPGGVYTATNIGKFPAQINVYEDIKSNPETGIDEYTTTGDIARLEEGQSTEISVPNGWFIEIHEPDIIALDLSSDVAEQSKPQADIVGKDISDVNIVFQNFVRNDVTGHWRLSRTSDNIHMQEYAVSYYDHYFEGDNEIHFIVNFSNNTTTKITYLMGDLEVDVYERIDGEEHDAKILPGGKLLAQYWVNMETGEIEDLQSDG